MDANVPANPIEAKPYLATVPSIKPLKTKKTMGGIPMRNPSRITKRLLMKLFRNTRTASIGGGKAVKNLDSSTKPSMIDIAERSEVKPIKMEDMNRIELIRMLVHNLRFSTEIFLFKQYSNCLRVILTLLINWIVQA